MYNLLVMILIQTPNINIGNRNAPKNTKKQNKKKRNYGRHQSRTHKKFYLLVMNIGEIIEAKVMQHQGPFQKKEEKYMKLNNWLVLWSCHQNTTQRRNIKQRSFLNPLGVVLNLFNRCFLRGHGEKLDRFTFENDFLCLNNIFITVGKFLNT